MNKLLILKSLEDQLIANKQDITNYEIDVINPKQKEYSQLVLNWFKENIDPTISNIRFNSESIYIFAKTNDNPNKVDSSIELTISIRSNYYDTNDPKYKQYCELNWFGSSITLEANQKYCYLEYLSCLGNIANNFEIIQNKLLADFYPNYKTISTELKKMYKAIYELESTISSLKDEIKKDNIDKYKQPGFECTLKNNSDYAIDSNNNGYIKISPQDIRLQIGRARAICDNVYINYFKIIKVTKYKCTLEIKSSYNDNLRTIEVSNNKFNKFINDVYNWQTIQSDKKLEENTRSIATKLLIDKNN